MSLRTGWNIGAAIAVFAPMLLFIIATLVDRRGERWWTWEGGDQEGGSTALIIFAYIYTLGVFGFLVWYGNRILQPKPSGFFGNGAAVSRSPLIFAMLVFLSMGFLCLLLIARFGCNYEGGESWFAQFGACVTLTYVSIMVFLGVYTILLSKDDSETDSTWEDLAPYQREENATGRKPRDDQKKRSWWQFGK